MPQNHLSTKNCLGVLKYKAAAALTMLKAGKSPGFITITMRTNIFEGKVTSKCLNQNVLK